jgi:hypothetical protein
MALVKCAECGEEVSDKAFSCPHCGNPLHSESFPPRGSSQSISQTNPAKNKKKNFPLLWTIFLVVVALTPVLFITSWLFINPSRKPALMQQLEKRMDSPIQDNGENPDSAIESMETILNNRGSKTYRVEKVSLWGYEFYTSKVDQSGSIDIGSKEKQYIAQLLKTLQFPSSLTRYLAIVSVDPTVVGKNDILLIPWGGYIATINLQPEGGLWRRVAPGAVIYLNNLQSSNRSILTHELGHQIGYHLTDEEWIQFYKLRGIPENTPRRANDWNLSPEEDFAEVYKSVYKSSVANEFEMGDWSVNTQYGFLIPSMLGIDYDTACRKLFDQIRQKYIDSNSKQGYSSEVWKNAEATADADPKVQECRKTHNGKSPLGGKLYISQTDKSTEQFIKNVVARLNRP